MQLRTTVCPFCGGLSLRSGPHFSPVRSMPLTLDTVRSQLSKNRASEFDRDVWNRYVLPPFFFQLDLLTATKPRVVVGGRGCGKTMLLRYFSHESVFSRSRPTLSKDALSQIGLYWRTDTQFCNAMLGRGLLQENWRSAFDHYLALTLTLEFLAALETISNSSIAVVSPTTTQAMELPGLTAFDDRIPATLGALKVFLRERLWEFETWVNNVRKTPEPIFLPGIHFLLATIALVRESRVGDFSSIACQIFIDEYESLCDYQQRTINTCLKHSEPPVVFHVAMRRHGFRDRLTHSAESVSDIHDYRTLDLEALLLEHQDTFPVFAGEILISALAESEFPVPINTAALRDPAALSARTNSSYTAQVKHYASSILPSLTADELCEEVFKDSSILSTLVERTTKALRTRGSRIDPKRFVRPSTKAASIIAPAMLSRQRTDPQDLLHELDQLERGRANKFTGSSGWLHNNFVGCYLQLYQPYSRNCPFYAGFETFVYLSRGNLRHFLELCYKSFARATDVLSVDAPSIEPHKQAEAARQASTSFLSEIRSFGRKGEQLHTFVLRLGTLFALAHSRPTQSEPEQSHFAITRGADELLNEDQDLLLEALRWSVLVEEPSTKQKDPTRPDAVDYVLNPIYAPYFFLSYRKRRKLELTSEQLICLIRGSINEYTELMRTFKRRWNVEDSATASVVLPLFSEDEE
ncbi:MAG: ORC-CDC6 family AAA ATPase [Betaproteobacteria bacterium]